MSNNATYRLLCNPKKVWGKRARPYRKAYMKLPEEEQIRIALVIDELREYLSPGKFNQLGVWSAMELLGVINRYLMGTEYDKSEK